MTVLHVHTRADRPQSDVTIRKAATRYGSAQFTEREVQSLIPKFLYRPRDVVEKTIANTTALAKGDAPAPLRRHIKSRFPQLNVRRTDETVASDTLFGSEVAIGGYTCAQLFVGLKSKRVDVYAMRSESDGPTALQDYIRSVGAPRVLRTDNSKMQLGTAWKRILRRMVIGTETTEPHHPWQNYAERTIGTIKRQVNTLLDRTGAPNNLWILALEHAAYVWNRTSHDSNNGATPLQVQETHQTSLHY